MIRGYVNQGERLQAVDNALERLDAFLWIDLVSPSQDEEADLEARLGIDLPTREEMEEIEISSRLYQDGGAAFMTATLPAQTEQDQPVMAPVTFVLAGHRLITVRYHEPRAFVTFPLRASRVNLGCSNGEAVLVALLEAIVDRLADVLERAGHEIDALSQTVFRPQGERPTAGRDFHGLLQAVGRKGDLTSKIRDSLVTLERLIGYLGHLTQQRKSEADIRARVETLARDAGSLNDYVSFLSQKVTFLLDATLGLVNIEQNAIIKIFSVAAVAFLPPTLIASIYGMNFSAMPELSSPYGYPLALGLMVISAVLPYLYFKRRGWL
jgi:magnesium transporter